MPKPLSYRLHTVEVQLPAELWADLPALSSSPPDPGFTYLPYPVLLLTLG